MARASSRSASVLSVRVPPGFLAATDRQLEVGSDVLELARDGSDASVRFYRLMDLVLTEPQELSG